MTKIEINAIPDYGRGEKVRAIDHHGRVFDGEILGIDARWPSYGKAGQFPNISYEIRHPTYRNKRYYCGEDKIIGRVE